MFDICISEVPKGAPVPSRGTYSCAYDILRFVGMADCEALRIYGNDED